MSLPCHTPEINNFEVALRMRDFEISQLTQRNNFFMVFQGVLFAGLVQSSHPIPVVSFMVCVVGLVASIFQVGMASGAKFWQEYWEQKLTEYEEVARTAAPELFHNKTCLYAKTVKERMNQRGFFGWASNLVLYQFSVSRIPIYIGIWLSVIWGLLALSTLRGYPPFAVPSFIVGFCH
jgi:hypothetical protein